MEVENGRFQLSLISKFRSEIMGAAIILVLLCHCDSFSWGIFHPYVQELAKVGSCGVDIFLFVSGFGLFYSMKKDSSIVHFYRKRFLRIIPEYFFIALVGYGVWDAIQKTGGQGSYLFNFQLLEPLFSTVHMITGIYGIFFLSFLSICFSPAYT